MIRRDRCCRGPVARRRRLRRPALVLLPLLLVLGACALHTTQVEVPVEPPATFSTSGVAEPPERWWTAFGDPALDRLVESALAGNLELAEVWERLREARAVADREASGLYPDVDGFAEGSVFRSSGEEDGFGRGFDGSGGDGGDFRDEDLRLGLTATYEVDLWGRIHSRMEAERFRAGAGLEDYRTAALTLSAEVARTWFQSVEARDQLALLDEQVEANRQILQLLENRFAKGQVRGVDVLRQRQLIEATRELRIDAEARAALLEHLLAVLLGRPPQGFDAAASADPVLAALPALPPLPETGLPAELVRRRPDVRAAWLRVEAADRDLAAAIARRYPRLTLGAGGDLDALDLFDAWTRSLTADLLAPLFRAGELEADAERAEAVRRQAVLRYGQATLTAFREVEDALVREAKQAERVASLERQTTLSEQALERLRMQYLNGLGDYIDVLTALTGAQQVRRDLLVARRQLLEDRVLLYRALAGGFESGAEAGSGSDTEPGPEIGGATGSENQAEAEAGTGRPPARKPGAIGDVDGAVNAQKSNEPPRGPARAVTPPPAAGSSPIRTREPAPPGADESTPPGTDRSARADTERPTPSRTSPAPRPLASPAGGDDLHRETP